MNLEVHILAKLTLYKCNCDSNVVDKSQSLSAPKQISNVRIKEGCESLSPVFVLQNITNIHNYNMLYYDKTGWYYNIDSVTYLNAERIEVHCTIDHLFSYASQILNTSQLVTRQETHKDTTIVDANIPIKNDRNVVYKKIGVSPFSVSNMTDTSLCCSLTVTG